MAVFWYKTNSSLRVNLYKNEMNKLIIKSLLSNDIFNKNAKIYFSKIFNRYTKISSIAFYRRFCVITGNSRSVFQKFKLVRHWCKSYASNGYLIGVRKASF